MNISRGKLENDLKYLSVFDKESNSISIIFLIKIGSRHESKEISGLAHFIEHNFFKGTETYPSSKSIGMAIENLGGSTNAFTSYEYTGYYIKSPKEKFDETIGMLADIIKNPLFPSAELDKEKGVIIEEIRMYQDIPMSKVGDIFMEQIYPEHPLGRDIAGTIETVSSFDREHVMDFIGKFYNAENVLVSVAGGVENQKAEDKIREHFSDISRGTNTKPLSFESKSLVEKSVSEVKDIEQTHIVLGGYGFDRHFKDRTALEVCFTILGSGFGSILFQVIREELGLAYYINARHTEFDDTGLWKVKMGVDNNRLEEALERLIVELGKFKNGEFGEEDIDRAKNFYMGNLVTDLETSEEIAMWYGMQDLLKNNVKTIDEIKQEIKSVTKDQILEIWHQLLRKDNIIITTFGPKEVDHIGILSNIV